MFQFGELRGTRFFTNQDGELVQDIDYQPFGEAASTGQPQGRMNIQVTSGIAATPLLRSG